MPEAQYALADLLSRSPSEPEHLVRAHMWANLSGAAGSEEARDLRDELEQRMSAAQVANAQGKARTWYDQRQAAVRAGSVSSGSPAAISSPAR
jgi:hypothetical protein